VPGGWTTSRVACMGGTPRVQQGHHDGPCRFGRDGGPMVHAEFLGLMMDVEHAPSPAGALYEQVTHLSAP